MKVYINYADNKFIKAQKLALKAAKYIGKFDKVIGYSRDDIDELFYNKNKKILDQERGGGFWLWKPYFINKTLEKISDGDYLFYSDSGAFFLKNVENLIYDLKEKNQDIMGFELPLIEKQWSKKELFINLNCNEEEYYESNQVMASFILIKKNNASSYFFRKYLYYSCNEINITDKCDNKIKQREDFIDHRHDQSIFSLLYKKNNLLIFSDPTQFGKYPCGYTALADFDFKRDVLYKLKNGREFRVKKNNGSNFGTVLFHHRNPMPLRYILRYIVKIIVTYISGLIK